MLMFGDEPLLLLYMALGTMSYLWMTILSTAGSIHCNVNLMSILHLFKSRILLRTCCVPRSFLSVPILVVNFSVLLSLITYLRMVFNINSLAHTLLSKMDVLKGSIAHLRPTRFWEGGEGTIDHVSVAIRAFSSSSIAWLQWDCLKGCK